MTFFQKREFQKVKFKDLKKIRKTTISMYFMIKR
jgi:hypothetical protein